MDRRDAHVTMKVHSSGRLSFLAIVPKIVLVELELVLVLVSVFDSSPPK
jgi:hypothetical protein